MGRKAAVISIDVNAGTAKMLVDLEKGKAGLRSFGSEGAGSMRQFGAAGVSEHKAVSAAMKTVEGNFLNNKRAADAFLTTIPGIGKALQVAFPVVGAVAFAGIIGEVGRKVYDFFKVIREAPAKVADAFRDLSQPLELTNDALRVSNDRLANDIAKLEGKPANGLQLALDEARQSADKLAESLDKDLKKIGEVLKKNSVGWWTTTFTGAQGTQYIEEQFKKHQDEINRITERGQGAMAAAGAMRDKQAADAARKAMARDLLAENRSYLQSLNAQISTEETSPYTAGKGSVFEQNPSDNASRLAMLKGVRQHTMQGMEEIDLTSTHEDLAEQKAGAEGDAERRKASDAQAKKDQAELLRLSKELERAQDARLAGLEKINAEETDEYRNLNLNENLSLAAKAKMAPLVAQIYDAKRLAVYAEEMDKYDKLIKQASDHWAVLGREADKAGKSLYSEEIKEGKKLIEEHAKAIEKLCQEYNKLTDAAAKQALTHKVTMIGLEPGASSDPLGTLARQQAVERQDIEDRYQNSLKLANSDLERANLLRERNLELQRLQNEMEQRTAEVRQKGIKDFFLEMQGQAKTAGNVIYDALNSTLDGVSDQFAKLFTGQKTSFGKMFQSVGEEMVKGSVKSAMQKGLGEFGKRVLHIDPAAGKPDGTDAHPFHVIVKGKDATGGDGGNFENLGGMVKSGASGLLKFLGGLFSRGGSGEAVSSSISYMAEGGDVDPGKAYGVADNKEAEIFIPRSGGSIIPMHKLGGDQYTYHIDARGADLGAANRTARAIEAAHDAAVRNSVRAQAEHGKRTPKRG